MYYKIRFLHCNILSVLKKKFESIVIFINGRDAMNKYFNVQTG